MNVWLDFAIDALAFGAVFMYGATGEILTEKSGHLNLGIPGIMCMGGAGGCLILNMLPETMPNFLVILLAILGSFAMAALTGLIYAFMTVTLRVNQNVTGLALTTFGSGLMMTIFAMLDASKYLKYKTIVKAFRMPFAERKDSLQRLGIMFFLALIIVFLVSFYLEKTKNGLNLRAVGENPATADAVGINVIRYKYVAIVVGSGISGLGGLYYIVDYMASNEAYKSLEAFGWLSIALVIFSLWKPYLSIVGSFVFGVLMKVSNMLSLIPGLDFLKDMSPKFILKMLPYLATVIVLIITSIRGKKENQPPAALGQTYFREDR